MSSPRLDEIVGRLEKGQRKTNEVFGKLTAEQWQRVVYDEPPAWTARDLLAHFASSEASLLELSCNIAAGDGGMPEGFDYDAFNAEEQARLRDQSPEELLATLNAARQKTLDWIRTLDDAQLDSVGNHPALGEITLETMLISIYGHQLFHMREVAAKLAGRG
jgi:hypothetical protein